MAHATSASRARPSPTGRAGVSRSSARASPVATELALIYQVREGDRLDTLAHKFFHDPRKWWLIADANPDAMTPEELLIPGRQLRIPKDRNA